MTPFQSVAKAIRIEYDPEKGSVYLVFHITDEAFKKEILEDFSKDVELLLKGTDLVKK